MRENFFDVFFWNTDAKQRVLMELARTHIRIQRWIMQKPCRKLGWIKFSDAGCTCGLLMKDVAVQVAMTVYGEDMAFSGKSRVTKCNADTTTGWVSQDSSMMADKYYYHH